MKVGAAALCLLITSVTACNTGSVEEIGLEDAQNEFSKRQMTQLVIAMDLESLFADPVAAQMAKAAEMGDEEALNELVENGADVNYRGTKGATFLFWAFRTNSFEGFDQLLKLGANPNSIFDDTSVLHLAALRKDVRYLSRAIEAGGNPNLEAGSLNETPIFKTIGVKGSDNQVARDILVRSGADVNARTAGVDALGRDLGGITPVMRAANLARFDVVLELIEMGADPTLKDNNGRGIKERLAIYKGRFPAGSQQEQQLNEVLLEIERARDA